MENKLIVGKEIQAKMDTVNIYLTSNNNKREKLKKFNLLNTILKKAADEKIFQKNHFSAREIFYLFLSALNILFFLIGYCYYNFPFFILFIFLLIPLHTLSMLIIKKISPDFKLNNEDNSQDIINEFRIVLQTMSDEEFSKFQNNEIEYRKNLMFDNFQVKLRNNDRNTHLYLDKIINRVAQDRKLLGENKEILLHTPLEKFFYKKEKLLKKYKKWKYIHFSKNKSKNYFKKNNENLNKNQNLNENQNFISSDDISKTHSIFQENILSYLEDKSNGEIKKNTFLSLLKKIRHKQTVNFENIISKYNLTEQQYKNIIFEVIETDFYKAEPLIQLDIESIFWTSDEYKEIVFNLVNSYPLAINHVHNKNFKWKKEEYKELIIQALNTNYNLIAIEILNSKVLNKFDFIWNKQDYLDFFHYALKNYADETLINQIHQLCQTRFAWTTQEYKHFALLAVKKNSLNLKFIDFNYFKNNINDYKLIVKTAVENDFQAQSSFDDKLLIIKHLNNNCHFTDEEYKQLALKTVELNGGYALKAINLYTVNWTNEEYLNLVLTAMKDEHKKKYLYYVAGYHTLKYVDFEKIYKSKKTIKTIIETSLQQDYSSYSSLPQDFKHLYYVKDFINQYQNQLNNFLNSIK